MKSIIVRYLFLWATAVWIFVGWIWIVNEPQRWMTEQPTSSQKEEVSSLASSLLLSSSSSSIRLRRSHVSLPVVVRSHDDCIPSNFHISPTSDVDVETLKINMTLSFTVPYKCYQDWTPYISYGLIDPTRDYANPKIGTILPNESIQFSFSNYVSRYQSSEIYHAILPNLQAGSIPYWYEVDLVANKSQVVEPSSSSSSSSSISSSHRKSKPSKRIPFSTPPLPMEPVRMALIADWGGSKEAAKTMRGMLSLLATPSAVDDKGDLNDDNNNDYTFTYDPSLFHEGRQKQQQQQQQQQTPPSSVPALSVVIVAGDISYANAHLPDWEDFLKTMEPLFSTIPLLVTPGNHEIECNRDDFQVYQAYEHYFRVPNRGRDATSTLQPHTHPVEREPIPSQLADCTHPAEFQTVYNYGNSFYFYKHGMVQVIVLNSYTNTTIGSVQYEWLVDVLKQTDMNRTKMTPWILVVFHCPLHTTFRGHNDEENPKLMLRDMEPLFIEYKVNIVLSGHNHAYVRTYPMVGPNRRSLNNVRTTKANINPTDDAPIYLTIGTGGDSHSKGPLHPFPEEWVAHRDNVEYGFGDLIFINTTHAYLQRILNRGEDADPSANDEVWIRNYYFDDDEDNDYHHFSPNPVSSR